MTQHDRYLLLGTVNGEVLVVEGDFFAKKDSIQTRVWTHIIGDAPITSLANIDGLLLVSTAESEGITILKLSLERSWEPAQS